MKAVDITQSILDKDVSTKAKGIACELLDSRLTRGYQLQWDEVLRTPSSIYLCEIIEGCQRS